MSWLKKWSLASETAWRQFRVEVKERALPKPSAPLFIYSLTLYLLTLFFKSALAWSDSKTEYASLSPLPLDQPDPRIRNQPWSLNHNEVTSDKNQSKNTSQKFHKKTRYHKMCSNTSQWQFSTNPPPLTGYSQHPENCFLPWRPGVLLKDQDLFLLPCWRRGISLL